VPLVPRLHTCPLKREIQDSGRAAEQHHRRESLRIIPSLMLCLQLVKTIGVLPTTDSKAVAFATELSRNAKKENCTVMRD